MKNFWAWSAKTLFILLVISLWYVFKQQQENESLAKQNQELQSQLRLIQEQVSTANTRIEELEKKSLDGILKETNKAVVSGWKTLLDTVENELEKARSMIEEENEKLQTTPEDNSHQKNDDTNEAIDNTIQGERT